jgi:Tfp pilus assembly protein PilP
MKRLASIVIVLGLTGCGGGGMDDLQTFVAESGRDMQGKIEPLPKVIVYEPFTYEAFDLPDPFKPRKLTTGGGGGTQPDLNRPKEPLEAFSLETLKMVGRCRKLRSYASSGHRTTRFITSGRAITSARIMASSRRSATATSPCVRLSRIAPETGPSASAP